MAHTNLAHPSSDRLAAFVSGRLGDVESLEIEQHVVDCAACHSVLVTLPDGSLERILQMPLILSESPLGAPALHQSAETPELSGLDRQLPSPIASESTCDEAAATAPGVPKIPRELADHPRYTVLAFLGGGGMGAVFEARHRLMDRMVALKVIGKRLVASPTAVERFRREVRAAAKLSHPNIVTAYDAEQADSIHFLVMERVEGKSLAQLVKERGPLPITEACDYIRQAALGLQHAFERGMVHRDIKPQNLMLTPEGQVKILDFGLARFVQESVSPDSIIPFMTAPGSMDSATSPEALTQVGTMMGTPDFIAPEQVNDPRTADVRADIYSLGCTLYYLLAGEAPFHGMTELRKLTAHQQETPRPISDVRTSIPQELAAVVNRMLAKRPEERYQTPAEVAAALLALHVERKAQRAKSGGRFRVGSSFLGLGWSLGAASIALLRLLAKRPKERSQAQAELAAAPPTLDAGKKLHPAKPRWRPRLAFSLQRSGCALSVTFSLGASLLVAVVYLSTRLPHEANKGGDETTAVFPEGDSPLRASVEKPPSQPADPQKEGRELASNIQQKIADLRGIAHYEQVQKECAKAAQLLGADLPALVSACWAECLLETLEKSGDRAQSLRIAREKADAAALVTQPSSYVPYVQALLLWREKRLTDAFQQLRRAFPAQGEDGPRLQNPHRQDNAFHISAEAAQRYSDVADWKNAVAAQKLAVELKPTTLGGHATLAEYAIKAEDYPTAKQAAESHLVHDAKIDIFKLPEQYRVRRADFEVAVLRAKAANLAEDLSDAVRWYIALADLFRKGQLQDVSALELQTIVIDPALPVTTQWVSEKPKDLERARSLARLHATKGWLLFHNEYDGANFPDAINRARDEYRAACECFSGQTSDPLLAEYIMWRGYLMTRGAFDDNRLDELVAQAKTASADFSGTAFLAGLAKHFRAVHSLNDGDAARRFSSEAIAELTKAIERGKGENPVPEFLDLYYSVRSAANLIRADYLYQQNRKDLETYGRGVRVALEDADEALKSNRRWPWYPEMQRAHALEDLAWRCEKGGIQKARFDEADASYDRAIEGSLGLKAQPIVGKGRALYRRVVEGKDSAAHLQSAERVLTDLVQNATFAREPSMVAEAYLWLCLVHLEQGGKEHLAKAMKAIRSTIAKSEEAFAAVILQDVFGKEIETAIRLHAEDPNQAHHLLEEVRSQCDLLAKRWPKQFGPAAVAKARCYLAEGDAAGAVKVCAEALKEPKIARADRFALLLMKVDAGLRTAGEQAATQDQLVDDADAAHRIALESKLGAASQARSAFWRGWARYARAKANQAKDADLEDSLRYIEEALAIDPSNPDHVAWKLRAGVVCIRLNKFDQAIEHAKQVVADQTATAKQKSEARDILDAANLRKSNR